MCCRSTLLRVAGILVATLFNHALAGAIGVWVTQWLGAELLRWVLGVSFLAMAVWTLIPDKFDESEAQFGHYGVFGTTLLAFFLAEMGDKTQVATVALAAQFQSLLDMTIVYPDGAPTFWEFLCGKTPRVILQARQLAIPAEFCTGDYEGDSEFRSQFHRWLAGIWEEKDQQIEQLLHGR